MSQPIVRGPITLAEIVAFILNGDGHSLKMLGAEVKEVWRTYETIVIVMKDGDEYRMKVEHTVEHAR